MFVRVPISISTTTLVLRLKLVIHSTHSSFPSLRLHVDMERLTHHYSPLGIDHITLPRPAQFDTYPSSNHYESQYRSALPPCWRLTIELSLHRSSERSIGVRSRVRGGICTGRRVRSGRVVLRETFVGRHCCGPLCRGGDALLKVRRPSGGVWYVCVIDMSRCRPSVCRMQAHY